jgi:FMN-dependent oxidoreductase (nitrilotriacetate monooxygenase family)
MAGETKPVVLTATVMGLGMHLGAWRYRDGDAFDYLRLDYFRDIARTAESGLLHAMFLADTLALSEENLERPNLGAHDPAIVLAALASVTEHLGLVATTSTTFNEPFNVARRFGTLDHLSGGRAAWNVVTTFVPGVAANFGSTALPQHDDRYVRAEEFLDVVFDLWASWRPGAEIGDKAAGVFADPGLVVPIDHRGEQFQVAGPLTLPATPQGRPVIFQAGASEPGRRLAARTADVVFTVQNTLDGAVAFRDDIRARAQALGRPADAVKVLPGIVPVIGRTREEAERRKLELDALSVEAELRKLALRVGVPVDALKLDEPLPVDLIRANTDFNASHGFRDAAVRLAESEGLTVRELLYRNGGGHLQVVGTASDVADTIQSWTGAGAADGFNLMIDVFPDGLEAVVEELVPELQRRGLFHEAYEGGTLRESLGLPDLAASDPRHAGTVAEAAQR